MSTAADAQSLCGSKVFLLLCIEVRVNGAQMSLAMRKNAAWTLLSHLIFILLLAIDTCVHAESSYGGDFKGCMSYVYETAGLHVHTYTSSAVIMARCVEIRV